MSVIKRGKKWYIYFRPFSSETIGIATEAKTKTEAKEVKRSILLAIRSNDFSQLAVEAREACIRLFANQSLPIPQSLANQHSETLTIMGAARIFFKDPEIKVSKTKDRYRQCLEHLVDYFKEDTPIESIWIPELKAYRITKQKEGLANGTINWQMVTLSKLFTVLEQHRLVQQNPVRLLKRLSTKESQRHVYLSFHDVTLIANKVPEWFARTIWASYYSGMRRGEILGLTWDCVDLKERIIYLGVQDTKENAKKRVPIHPELLSILQNSKVRGIGNQDVFTINGKPIGKDSTKRPWDRTVGQLGFDTKPNFHDLRHTFKVNCLESGVGEEIRERIMGHQDKELSVTQRYGYISNRLFVKEIDKLTFDHGETKIWVEKKEKRTLTKC